VPEPVPRLLEHKCECESCAEQVRKLDLRLVVEKIVVTDLPRDVVAKIDIMR
jgi:hypothetical protein